MRTAVGVFDIDEAGRVLDDLRRIGCSEENMSIIAHPTSAEAERVPAGLREHIAGLHEATIPEVGGVCVAGPLGEQFAGTDLRASLITNGLTEAEAARYVEEVRLGGAIVAAEVEDAALPETLATLEAHGPRRPERREGEAPTAAAETRAEEATAAQESPVSVDRPVEAADLERSVAVHERQEVPVIEKTPHVVEEVVVVLKEETERPETVRATARHQDVEVEPIHADAGRFGTELRERRREGDWAAVEPEAQREWEARKPGTWEKIKMLVRHAFEPGSERK